MLSAPAHLSALIDFYLDWLIGWHRVVTHGGVRADLLPQLDTPKAGALSATAKADKDAQRRARDAQKVHSQPASQAPTDVATSATGPQIALSAVTSLQDQLHTLARLVVMKSTDAQPIAPADDESVITRYRELMLVLRRLERAFAAAAAGLDPLTGLQTRSTMLQMLQHALSNYANDGRAFCVAIMDIDHFKKVNDTHGHDAGDRVLAAVADHVSRSLRGDDDAYRFGGEEFVLYLKDADLPVGLAVLERLRANLAQMPITLLNGTHLRITASFGLSVSALGQDGEMMLKRADEALYRAKQNGRNKVVTA